MIVDLTTAPQLSSFPFQDVVEGLARARKTVTTFYGDVHSTQYTSTADARWTDKDQWRWYNALAHGANVEGFNVNLTACKTMAFSDYWWARSHQGDRWAPTDNMRFFGKLQSWLKGSGIFSETGRQVFFIQLNGQHSPIHTDFDPLKVPEELRAPGEFIWLTPPDRPKTLTVGGQAAPWCCWFDHFVPHGTSPEADTRWSLRVDGVFAKEFRDAHVSR